MSLKTNDKNCPQLKLPHVLKPLVQMCATSLLWPRAARSQWNIALSPFHFLSRPKRMCSLRSACKFCSSRMKTYWLRFRWTSPSPGTSLSRNRYNDPCRVSSNSSFSGFSAPCRQLSEENANLHESVEKESTEKKRLSMNNEELLWRLQTSPLMSPASSPLHRSFSTSPVPSSPLFFLSSSPSNTAAARCDSPTHCQGCGQTPQYGSPAHRAGANHNLPSSPATPTHRAAANLNYSPGPATPTHRASANRCNPAACSLQRWAPNFSSFNFPGYLFMCLFTLWTRL